MEIAVIGLGRMGGNIVRRLLRDGHRCVVHDTSAEAMATLAREGATAVAAAQDVAAALQQRPRAIWLMLPAGEVTEGMVATLAPTLAAGDILIDGGNTFYKDDIRRAGQLRQRGIEYVDVGTSGGVWGLERGYCLMIGGSAKVVEYLDPIFRTLAPGIGDTARTRNRKGGDPRPEQGYLHAGAAGSGHFVKMVHNGIEYGVMQAYAEGFDLLQDKAALFEAGGDGFNLNVADIAETWRRGSVVMSWLLDLCAEALAADDDLIAYSGEVADSGEGRWTVQAAVEQGVPLPVLTTALYERFASRDKHHFVGKLLSAMRHGFGGHNEGRKPE